MSSKTVTDTTVEEMTDQVPADDFRALENKIYRTIELYKAARQGQLAAEKEVEKLKHQADARDTEVTSLRRELVLLRKEREDVRGRVEKMLGQIEALAEEQLAS
jgi:translation initiation factor 2B subunit (eIF-2B alpha/beta/delta family)